MTIPHRPDNTVPKEINSIEDMPDNALVEEVAQFFRVTIPVVRKWIREGVFPNAYKPSRSFLVPKGDIIALMQKKYGNAVKNKES